MIPEDLMRKYKYGYIHSCEILEEPFIKDLLKENQELKKRLENCYCNRTDCTGRIKDSKAYDSLEQKVENQQKEFIEYLENKINDTKQHQAFCKDMLCHKEFHHNIVNKTINENSLLIRKYQEILSKYKEIIEDDKNG